MGTPAGRRRSAVLLHALALVLTVAACSTPAGATAVPRFASAVPTTAPAADSGPVGPLPVDCERVLSGEEVTALLGLPLEGVAVSTTVGVPAPAVGRLARTTCTYAVTDPSRPVRGEVLRLTLGAFADADAARLQSTRNLAVEAGRDPVVPVDLGAARAAAVLRGDTDQLMLSYDTVTVDVVLRPRLAGAVTSASPSADLALRVLDRIKPAGPQRPGDGSS